MNLIDMHCDTLWKMMDLDKHGNLEDNNCSVSIPNMKKGGTMAQFFACFGYLDHFLSKGGYDGCYSHIIQMTEFFKSQLQQYAGDIAPACSAKQIKDNKAAGKISAILTVEEGGILNGNIDRLQELYDCGVRLITLMWNHENCIGYPNSKSASMMWQGLKPFGMKVVEQMNELGMIIDVSHSSEGTFRDIMECNNGPIVASHSNCRALCDHPRNLSDEMIRELANAGGVAGLNFYGPFLGTALQSRLDEMVYHILHMINVGGSDFPAIGTDFDGFDGMEKMDIADAGHMELLWNGLQRKGVSEVQLDKIWSGNAMRVLTYLN